MKKTYAPFFLLIVSFLVGCGDRPIDKKVTEKPDELGTSLEFVAYKPGKTCMASKLIFTNADSSVKEVYIEDIWSDKQNGTLLVGVRNIEVSSRSANYLVRYEYDFKRGKEVIAMKFSGDNYIVTPSSPNFIKAYYDEARGYYAINRNYISKLYPNLF